MTTPSTRYPALIAFSSSSAMAELRDFQCHSHTIGTIGDRSVPSDHPIIRRWLTQHPLFISALGVEHRNMVYDVDPFIALDQFTEVAFRACAKARQAILTNTPTTLGAKLLVACTALRAHRNGLTATVKQ